MYNLCNPYSLGAQIERAQTKVNPEDFMIDDFFDEAAYLTALQRVEDEILDGYINQ